MTKENINILNNLSLIDVMRGWGHVPRHYAQDGKSAWFLCPWHDDHHESLEVRMSPISGASDLSFRCWACGQKGFGAIQLATQLMGLPAGKVSKEDLSRVLVELATRCEVELEQEESSKPWCDTFRKKVIGWEEFKKEYPQYDDMNDGEARFERGEWTVEGLKALGLKVELATRKLKKSEYADYVGPSEKSEIKVGDTLTQFDPDTGEALYRCSMGKDFYRGQQKAEVRTIKAWGEEVERVFSIQPCGRFMLRQKPGNGGAVVLDVKSTKNYPMFMFQYPWGTKKYEPKDAYGHNKWTWYNIKEDSDLYHQWYADKALTDVMNDALMKDGVLPDKDERHPYVLIEKDSEGNST